jgi:hypothetical protein
LVEVEETTNDSLRPVILKARDNGWLYENTPRYDPPTIKDSITRCLLSLVASHRIDVRSIFAARAALDIGQFLEHKVIDVYENLRLKSALTKSTPNFV